MFVAIKGQVIKSLALEVRQTLFIFSIVAQLQPQNVCNECCAPSKLIKEAVGPVWSMGHHLLFPALEPKY